MRTNLKTVCALSVFAMAGGSVLAGGPIGIGDFSGSEQVITFDPGFGRQCAPYLYEDVTFDEDGDGTGGECFTADRDWGGYGYFSNIPGASQGLGFNDGWGNSKIIMNPPAGTNRFGCLLSTGVQTDFTLSLYDGSNNLLGSVTGSMPAAGEAVFLGYETNSPIARAEVTEPNGENSNITLMDDVRFEGGSADCLTLAVDPLVAGQSATWSVSGATAGEQVAVVYGFGPGSTSINGYAGYCATFGIQGVNQNKVICTKAADGNGDVSCKKSIPAGVRGRRVLSQAAERNTCPDECVSNLDDQTVG